MVEIDTETITTWDRLLEANEQNIERHATVNGDLVELTRLGIFQIKSAFTLSPYIDFIMRKSENRKSREAADLFLRLVDHDQHLTLRRFNQPFHRHGANVNACSCADSAATEPAFAMLATIPVLKKEIPYGNFHFYNLRLAGPPVTDETFFKRVLNHAKKSGLPRRVTFHCHGTEETVVVGR